MSRNPPATASFSTEQSNFDAVRKEWIKKQLKTREGQFTQSFSIKSMLVSWNVNMAKPGPEIDLSNLFSTCGEAPDLVAFGWQELDMTAEGLLLRETAKASVWVDYVKWSLDISAAKMQGRNPFIQPPPTPTDQNLNGIGNGPATPAAPAAGGWGAYWDYVKSYVATTQQPAKLELPPVEEYYDVITFKQLVGVLVAVFVAKKHSKFVSEIQSQIVTTGILGVMGNKGGAGIRFKLHDSTFCFLNAHFNAHQTNVQRRNQDYRDICTMIFNIDGLDYTIFDHDNVFWIGDLNYRIDLEDSLVRTKIRERDWASLYEADQLRVQIAKGNVFTGWEEAPIAFAPTYKYDSNSDEYDSSEKRRVPAWCDRILWRPSPSIKNLHYTRHEYKQSDHRPVSAHYQIGVKSVVQSSKLAVLQEIIKEWDKMENDSIPDAAVSTTECNFGEVRFGVPGNRTITLENIGRVNCRYRFIPKLNETKPCKDWLFMHPALGILAPGEKVNIALTININEHTALPFNLGKEKIEDIIILHLENGKDYFVSVIGKYQRSSFGNRLEYLVRFQQPIRSSEPAPPKDTSSHLRIPKELWRIIDYVFKNSMEEEDLFLETGNSDEMGTIREALDTGADFPAKLDPHSMPETLLRFLESLDMPVVPYQLYNNVLQAAAQQSSTQAKAVIAKLPEVYYNTFFYVIAFLREVLQLSAKNKLTPEKLAFVFSSVLVRPPPGTRQTEASLKKQAAFIQHFLAVTDLQMTLPPPKSLSEGTAAATNQ